MDSDLNNVVQDSFILYNILPGIDEQSLFEELWESTNFFEVHHKGGALPRMVAIQGLIGEDGSRPVYRHPLDDEPEMVAFTETVDKIRLAVIEKVQKYREASVNFNHALIQLYRSGKDFISEHADKTLDIAPDSVIANFSVGSKRTMILRDKDKGKQMRETYRVPLRSNSVFVLGLTTNRNFLHEIKKDSRRAEDKDDEERGTPYNGARISITFREIATFRFGHGELTGQGASFGCECDEDSLNAELLKAFREENTTKEDSTKIYASKNLPRPQGK